MASNGIIEFNGDLGSYLEDMRQKKAEKKKNYQRKYKEKNRKIERFTLQ